MLTCSIFISEEYRDAMINDYDSMNGGHFICSVLELEFSSAVSFRLLRVAVVLWSSITAPAAARMFHLFVT